MLPGKQYTKPLNSKQTAEFIKLAQKQPNINALTILNQGPSAVGLASFNQQMVRYEKKLGGSPTDIGAGCLWSGSLHYVPPSD